MAKYFVASSYENFDQIGEPFENEKGKQVIRIKRPCPRCGGLGIIVSHVENGCPIPIPVDGGVCYKCNGTKFEEKIVRVYTEKEYQATQKAKERAANKRKEAAARQMEKNIEKAAKYKHQVALKLGFGEEEKAYLVYGDDTFAIKNKLKEMGARFDPTLKWYFAEKVELPDGYFLCEFSFDELYNYNPARKWAQFKEDAQDIVRKRMIELKGPSTSVYYPGKEKDRIRNITAKVASIRGFEGYYGYTNVYTFTSENYVFIWMTGKDLDVAAGDVVDLTGTIKKFDEYMGVSQTHLNRCVIEKIVEE